MKKKAVKKIPIHKKSVAKHHRERPVRWLPIDSRFITPFFKFGTVGGVERLFLEIEITLAIFIVLGTLIVAAIHVVGLFIK